MQIAGHQTSREKEGEGEARCNKRFLSRRKIGDSTKREWWPRTRDLTRPSPLRLTLNAALTSPAGKLFRKRRHFTWSAAASEL